MKKFLTKIWIRNRGKAAKFGLDMGINAVDNWKDKKTGKDKVPQDVVDSLKDVVEKVKQYIK